MLHEDITNQLYPMDALGYPIFSQTCMSSCESESQILQKHMEIFETTNQIWRDNQKESLALKLHGLEGSCSLQTNCMNWPGILIYSQLFFSRLDVGQHHVPKFRETESKSRKSVCNRRNSRPVYWLGLYDLAMFTNSQFLYGSLFNSWYQK